MQVPTARRFAIGLLAGAFFLMPSMASAQHAEVSGAVGYTFSDGVSGNFRHDPNRRHIRQNRSEGFILVGRADRDLCHQARRDRVPVQRTAE